MFNKNRAFRAVWSLMLTLILLLPLLFSANIVQAQGSSQMAPLLAAEDGEIVPDHYIVVYKSGAAGVNAEEAVRSSVAAQGGEVKFVYKAALNGYSAYLPPNALASVRADPAVEYVIPDARVQFIPDGELGGVVSDGIQSSATWGLDRIDQRDLPLSTTYKHVYSGRGVHVYVIDTGIRANHVEFGGRAKKVHDSIGDGQNGNDCAGHGTHVSGTIGGATYGVAKKALLYGVRVLDCFGFGTYSQVIDGVDWVTAHRVKPAVANMSLGGTAYAPLDTAINAMINHGVVLVVAAGNSNLNACNYSPARVPGAITVGATDSTDARAYYSNWGKCLDIFAPGSNITSAWNSSNTATNTIDGTSMASPHVTGVVALYMETHRTASVAKVRKAVLINSTKNKVISPGSGSVNRLLFSLFPRIPDALSPSGTITDQTPTYKWSRVAGATQYRYQIWKGRTLIFTKTVSSGICGSYNCKHTPGKVLTEGTKYKWRVQAFAKGAWKPYSPYKTFTVAP